jgi:hypothetical protein
VNDGRLPGVVVLAVVLLLPLVAFEALVPLVQSTVLVMQVRSAARRAFGLLDERPAVRDLAAPLPLPRGPVADRAPWRRAQQAEVVRVDARPNDVLRMVAIREADDQSDQAARLLTLVVGGLAPQAEPVSARTARGDRAVARVLVPSASSRVYRQ